MKLNVQNLFKVNNYEKSRMYEIYFKIEIKILEPYVNLFKVNLFLANVPILYPLNTGEFR